MATRLPDWRIPTSDELLGGGTPRQNNNLTQAVPPKSSPSFSRSLPEWKIPSSAEIMTYKPKPRESLFDDDSPEADVLRWSPTPKKKTVLPSVDPTVKSQDLLSKFGTSPVAPPRSVIGTGTTISSTQGTKLEPISNTWGDKLKAIGKSAYAGLTSFNNSMMQGVKAIDDFLADNVFYGQRNNLLKAIYEPYIKENERAQQEAKKEELKGNLHPMVNAFTQSAVGAVPNLGLGILSGGGTAIGQAAGTVKSLSGMALDTAKNLATNPQFLMSAARSFGNAYQTAAESGADTNQAITAAVLQALPESIIEVSGGTEKVVQRLADKAKGLSGSILQSALEEGIEEIIQYPFAGIAQKATYNPDMPLWSTTGPAIINPIEMGTNAAMGGMVGLLMGGGAKALNAATNSLKNRTGSTLPKAVEVDHQIQPPVNSPPEAAKPVLPKAEPMQQVNVDVVDIALQKILSGQSLQSKDIDLFTPSPKNYANRARFEAETGVKLPSTSSETRAVIRRYAFNTDNSQPQATPDPVVDVPQQQDSGLFTVRQRPEPVTPQPETIPIDIPHQSKPILPSAAPLPSSAPAKGTAYTPDNQSVDYTYRVVPADQLIASNDAQGNPNPAYPAELQPRDRSRAASQMQIQDMAAKLNPAMLGESNLVSDGAPMVGADLIVESGNGRVAAIRQAMQTNPQNATAYHQYLLDNAAKFGLDPANIPANGILVRVRDTDLDRVDFVRRANQSSVAAYSASETATIDAQKLDSELLSLFVPSDDGQINTKDNRPFIARFLDRMVPKAEQSRYIQGDGKLSQEGLNRVRNAMFQRAYGDSQLLLNLSESLDDDAKNITRALTNAAPNVVAIKTGIENGSLYPLDISEEIVDAVRFYSDLKNSGQTVQSYIDQITLGTKKSPETLAIAAALEQYKRSGKAISEYLTSMCQGLESLGDPNQVGFFEAADYDKGDVIHAGERIFTEQTGRQLSTIDLGGGNPGSRMGEDRGIPGVPKTAGAASQPGKARSGESRGNHAPLPRKESSGTNPVLPRAETIRGGGESQYAAEIPKQGVSPSVGNANTVGAMESRFPQKQKTSQVYENTYLNTPMLTDIEKETKLDPKDYLYDVVPEKLSLAEADERLQVDFEGEVSDLRNTQLFDGTDLDTAMGVMKRYLEEARETGDYAKVLEWSKIIRENGTKGGQMIQAFAKYSRRTAEGLIVKAQKAVTDAEENSKLKPDVDQDTNNVINIIDNARDGATDEAGKEAVKIILENGNELTPEQRLAQKVDSTTKPLTSRQADAVTDMVNELFRLAQESPLPTKKPQPPRNPMDFLYDAIDNKKQYADVWDKAKEILSKKHQNNPDILDMLNKYFDKGVVPPYSQKTVKKSIGKAAEDIGVDLNKIMKSSKGDKQRALDDITDYITRYTDAYGEDARLLAEQIQKKYNEILAQKAQSKLKQLFRDPLPRTQKSTFEKVLELINMGAYDDESIRNIIRQRHNLPSLTKEDITAILDNMDKAKAAPEGSYEQKIYESRAGQIVADKEPVTTHDRFRAAQRLNLILNPKTLITRNPAGNIILGAAENIKDIPGSMVDRLVSLKTGERTTALPSAGALKAQAKGFGKGIKEWGLDIKNNVDTSPSRGQMELPNKRIFKNKLLNALDQFERRALNLGDRPFYQAAYEGRLAELKKLGREIDADAYAEAKLYAMDRVLQNDSDLSKRASKIRNSLGYFGDVVMPFTQTPANIMDKLLDYSPAGMAKAVYHLGQSKNKNSAISFDQKLFVDRIARSMTGTGLAVLAYAMAAKGLLTGSLDKDKDARSAQYRGGQQPYAIKLGNAYYSYDWAQPIAGIMAMAADSYQAGQSKDDFLAQIQAGGEAAINTLFDQSFLSGVMNMLSGYSPAAGIARTLTNSTSQLTNSGLASAARVIDPYQRETYDPSSLRMAGNKLLARIPFASKLLPSRVDTNGQPLLQSQGRDILPRAFDNFVSPGKYTTVQDDPVNNELLRLYQESGYKGQFLKVVDKKLEYTVGEKENKKKEVIPLTSTEYLQHQTQTGQTSSDIMRNLIETEYYQEIGDYDREAILKDAIEYAVSISKQNILDNHGITDYSPDSWVLEAQEGQDTYGIPVADFLVWRKKFGTVKPIRDENGKTIKEATLQRGEMLMDDKTLTPEQRSFLYESLGKGGGGSTRGGGAGAEDPNPENEEKPGISFQDEESFILSHMSEPKQKAWETVKAAGIDAQTYEAATKAVSGVEGIKGVKNSESLFLRERLDAIPGLDQAQRKVLYDVFELSKTVKKMPPARFEIALEQMKNTISADQ